MGEDTLQEHFDDAMRGPVFESVAVAAAFGHEAAKLMDQYDSVEDVRPVELRDFIKRACEGAQNLLPEELR